MIRIDDCLVVPTKAPFIGAVSRCISSRLLPWVAVVVHHKRDGMMTLKGGSWQLQEGSTDEGIEKI